MMKRLMERKLFHWAAAYLAGAWALLQVLDLVGAQFDWPPLVGRAAVTFAGVGFLAALVVAWFHGERGHQRVTGMEIGMLSGIFVIAGGTFVLVERGAPAASAEDTPARSDAAASPSLEALAPDERSIAVLPFANMSSDEEQEYFSDGLTEELLNVLAQIPELRVAARTSSFAFKGVQVPVDSIGRTLRVAHVLEGSVRKADDRVRITAQLIDARTGFHLFSETYDRDIEDVFAVQEEIARAIADKLRVQLGGGRVTSSWATTDAEVHDLHLRARAAMAQGTVTSLLDALRLYEEILDRDPTYAPAHAGMAFANIALADLHLPPAEGYGKARVAAARALALDSTLASAHSSMGMALVAVDFDLESAERHMRKALSLAPGSAEAHFTYANFLCLWGKADEGYRQAELAFTLDPLSPIVGWQAEMCLLIGGQYDRIIAEHDRFLGAHPGWGYIESWLAAAHRAKGNFDAALAEYERLRPALGDSPYGLALTLVAMGRTDEARRIQAALETRAETEWVPRAALAAVAEALGERDRALAMVAEGIALKDLSCVALGWIPETAGLVEDPRYREILTSHGLSPVGLR